MDLVSATGRGKSTTIYILRGGRDNLRGRPEIHDFGLVRSVNEVNTGIEKTHPSLFGNWRPCQTYSRYI